MSYICDQACVFCSESSRMEAFAASPISYANIVRTLARKRKDGCRHVTFTGGEPTLHPRIIDALAAAKRLGYTTYMTTDASKLANADFAARCLPLLDEVCISLHGDSPEVHDALAASPGSFQRVMTAIAAVAAAPKKPYLLINVVLTRSNISRVPALVRLLAGLGPVKHCTISNLAPDGAALPRLAEIQAPLAEIETLAGTLSRISAETGLVVRFFGVPLCLMGGDWNLPNDLHWTPRVTVERGLVDGKPGLQEIHSPHPGRLRFYAPACEGCTMRDRCFGVFKAYYDIFGDGELKPRLDAASGS